MAASVPARTTISINRCTSKGKSLFGFLDFWVLLQLAPTGGTSSTCNTALPNTSVYTRFLYVIKVFFLLTWEDSLQTYLAF